MMHQVRKLKNYINLVLFFKVFSAVVVLLKHFIYLNQCILDKLFDDIFYEPIFNIFSSVNFHLFRIKLSNAVVLVNFVKMITI